MDHKSYEHDQERIVNMAAQAVQTTASIGAQMWINRPRPIKVEVKTAAQDVQTIRDGMQQGKSSEEMISSISQGEVAQRVANAGGDPQQYAQLMMQKADIEEAKEKMPTQELTQRKTHKKKL